MTDDRDREIALNRFWNALIGAEPPPAETTLTPEEMAVLQLLHRAGSAPFAGISAAAAWPHVLARMAAARTAQEDPMARTTTVPISSLTMHPNGRMTSRSGPPPSPLSAHPSRRGRHGLVAAVALVVLMLMAGFFVGSALRPTNVATAPADSPAMLVAPATPSPTEAVRGLLVETTVPAAALPTGEERFLHISQATIQPGVVVTIPAEEVACCPGPLMDHVLAGELTVRVDGPLQVVRTGTPSAPGPVEEVAPGTAVVLQAGDTALYDQALSTEYANHGTEPVQLVGGGMFNGRPQVSPPGLKLNNFDSLSPLPSLPAGPVTFVLEQVMLEPGAILPSPPAGALRVVTSGPTIAYLPKAADGSVTNLTRKPIQAYALTLIPLVTAGTPTAEAEIVKEILIDVPDASLPAGPVQIYAGYTDLQPGVSASLGGQVGTSSYYVEQGTVRISHADAEQIVHAGEQWSAPQDGDWGLENVGDDLARVIQADVNDALGTSSVDASTNSKFSDPEGYADIFVIQAASTLPPGMGRVTLQRLTLPPGTAMEPYTKTEFEWIGVATGRVGVTLEGERLPFRWDAGEERTYGLFKSPPAIQPGTEMTLRNAGDDTLVLYHLTITSNDAGGSSGATPTP